MKCPRCSAPITGTPDAQGYLVCAGCGARLRSRAAAQAAQAAAAAPAPASAPAPATPPPPPPLAVAAVAPSPSAPPTPADAAPPSEMALLLAEMRAVRHVQQEILALLRARPGLAAPASLPPQAGPDFGPGFDASADDEPRPARTTAARSGRRVILLDDDPLTRQTAAQLLTRQGLEVVAAKTGHEAIGAIAATKPDAIVLEIGIEGEMPGRDFVNIVKATMEWVDVPLLLYTRMPVADEEEARTVHGADQFVQKGPGAEAVLGQRLAQVLGR